MEGIIHSFFAFLTIEGRKKSLSHSGKAMHVWAAYSPTIKSILNLLLFDETAVEFDDVVDEPVNDDNDLVDLLLFVELLPPKLCVKLCRLKSQFRRNTLPQEQW